MTIEAKLDKTNALLEQLLAKFDHIGQAAAPAKPQATPPIARNAEKAASKPAGEPDAVPGFEKQVKPAALKLLAKNREKLTEINAKFGVKKTSELKAGQYAEYLAALNGALA